MEYHRGNFFKNGWISEYFATVGILELFIKTFVGTVPVVSWLQYAVHPSQYTNVPVFVVWKGVMYRFKFLTNSCCHKWNTWCNMLLVRMIPVLELVCSCLLCPWRLGYVESFFNGELFHQQFLQISKTTNAVVALTESMNLVYSCNQVHGRAAHNAFSKKYKALCWNI